MSSIAVLKEIVKNMKVPDGILNHVLETHKDKLDKDYPYDVCEFLAEAIEVSDKERFGLLNIGRTPMGNNFFLKIGVYEGIIIANLGYSGRFNNQKDAETAKKYSSSIISLCKEQSRLISEKEYYLAFDSFFKFYLNLPENKKKSIKEEYKNNQDLLRSHANQIKDPYDYLAKKHEFILNNFSYLKEILVRYFEKRKTTENLIGSAYTHEPLFDISLSEDVVLDELNRLKEHLNSTNNINYVKLKDSIIKIQEYARYLDLGLNQTIKKILVTKITGQLKNRLENLL